MFSLKSLTLDFSKPCKNCGRVFFLDRRRQNGATMLYGVFFNIKESRMSVAEIINRVSEEFDRAVCDSDSITERNLLLEAKEQVVYELSILETIQIRNAKKANPARKPVYSSCSDNLLGYEDENGGNFMSATEAEIKADHEARFGKPEPEKEESRGC